MRIFPVIVIAGLFAIALFSSCSQQQDPPVTINENEIELSIQDINEFSYVAILHNGFAEDYRTSIRQFEDEIRKQHIIPTGPLFVLYYTPATQLPIEKIEWEIGLPTAEGTLVEGPLTLKNWRYHRVVQAKYIEVRPDPKDIYPPVVSLIENKHLGGNPAIVIRILDETSGLNSQKQLKSEIWVPLENTSRYAE